MSKTDRADTVFQVNLKGFPLTANQHAAIEAALRSAVMAEIAKLDFREPIGIEYMGGPGTVPGIEARVLPKA